MMENQVILTSPGIDNSLGHDKYSMLMERALIEAGMNVLNFTLKPIEFMSSSECIAWSIVESGKHKFSEHARNGAKSNVFQKLAGNAVNQLTGPIRNSTDFQNTLTQSYRQKLKLFENLPVVSSHYMSFMPDQPGLFLTPDIHLHTASHNMLRQCTRVNLMVPQKPVLNSILKQNNSLSQRVDSHILPVSEKMLNAVDKRIEKQKALSEGEILTHNILVTIGGSGPEIPEVIMTIQKLLENPKDKFRRYYQLHVLCGDQSKSYNKDFADHLNILKQQFGNLIDFEIACNRREELDQWYTAMENPLYDALITRPNEMLTIGPALGFRTILLQPFQQHEEYSVRAGMLQKNCESNVYRMNWLLDESNKFSGFHRDNIALNYRSNNFWCKSGKL